MLYFSTFRQSFPRLSSPVRRCASLANNYPAEINILGKTYPTDEWTNLTARILSLVGKKLFKTPSNPLQLISAGISDHFSDFDLFEYPSPVVTVRDNFDSLLIPKDHISRGRSDTYYVNSKHLLRCHTSAHQSHCLETGSQAFICIADVYRRDAIDSTHYPVFHQCEGFKICDRHSLSSPITAPGVRNAVKQEYHREHAVSIASFQLHSAVESYIRRLLPNKDLQLRWVPAYFPFTHPSWELEIFHNGKWLEILGCGIVEHRILCENGIHNDIAWAFGVGIERLAMLKYSIPDIRVMWSQDFGFLGQFKSLSPWDSYTFKPISKFPQLINDISFWLPIDGQFCSNDFYDLVRSVAGDLVEQVDLVDEYTEKKSNKTSHCYRIYYRSHERNLTQEEINVIHKAVEKTASRDLKVKVR